MSLGSWFVFGYEGFPREDRQRFYSQRDDPCDSDEERRIASSDDGLRCFRFRKRCRNRRGSGSSASSGSSSGRGEDDIRQRGGPRVDCDFEGDDGWDFGDEIPNAPEANHSRIEEDFDDEQDDTQTPSSLRYHSRWVSRDRSVKVYGPLRRSAGPRGGGSVFASASCVVPAVVMVANASNHSPVIQSLNVIFGGLGQSSRGSVATADGGQRFQPWSSSTAPAPMNDVMIIGWRGMNHDTCTRGHVALPAVCDNRGVVVLQSAPVTSLKRWFPSDKAVERFGHCACGLPAACTSVVFPVDSLQEEFLGRSRHQGRPPSTSTTRSYLSVAAAFVMGGSIQSDPRAGLEAPMQQWDLRGTTLSDPMLWLHVRWAEGGNEKELYDTTKRDDAVGLDGEDAYWSPQSAQSWISWRHVTLVGSRDMTPRAFFTASSLSAGLSPSIAAAVGWDPTEVFSAQSTAHFLIFGGTEAGAEPSTACGNVELVRVDIGERMAEVGLLPCCGTPPEPRFGHSMHVTEGHAAPARVLIFGGVGAERRVLGDAFMLDLTTMVWCELLVPIGACPLAGRAFHASCLLPGEGNVGESLLIVGGETTGGTLVPETLLYRVDENIMELVTFPLVLPSTCFGTAQQDPPSRADETIRDTLDLLQQQREHHQHYRHRLPVQKRDVSYGASMHGSGAVVLPVTSQASGRARYGALVVGGRASLHNHRNHCEIPALCSFIAARSATLKETAALWILRGFHLAGGSQLKAPNGLESHVRRLSAETTLRSWQSDGCN